MIVNDGLPKNLAPAMSPPLHAVGMGMMQPDAFRCIEFVSMAAPVTHVGYQAMLLGRPIDWIHHSRLQDCDIAGLAIFMRNQAVGINCSLEGHGPGDILHLYGPPQVPLLVLFK